MNKREEKVNLESTLKSKIENGGKSIFLAIFGNKAKHVPIPIHNEDFSLGSDGYGNGELGGR